MKTSPAGRSDCPERGKTIDTLIVGGQGVPQLEVPLLARADVERLGVVARIPAMVSRLVFGS